MAAETLASLVEYLNIFYGHRIGWRSRGQHNVRFDEQGRVED